MSNPIRIGGFFSTFDTEAVISQLTRIRMRQVNLLEVKSMTTMNRKAAMGQVQSLMGSLLGKINALSNNASVSGRAASVNGTAVTVATTPSSQLGSFNVDVTRLASATRLTGTAISAGINAALPMNEANFATQPTSGKFTIATASGGSQTFSVGAAVANSSAVLDSANIAMTVTSGTFTIATVDGGSAEITIDTATQSLDDVLQAINNAGVGITATLTSDGNGRANQITLESTQGAVTLTDGTSNFLSAVNLFAAPGAETKVSTAAFTQRMSLNEVLAEINGSTIGVTASIVNDSNGQPSLINVTSTQGNISFGNGGDTSNFLAATGLLTSSTGTSRTSSSPISRLNVTAKLSETSLSAGAPAPGDHHLVINSVQVAYNAETDSLSDLINRINSSEAGVTAKYDSLTDTVRLQNKATGALTLTVSDDGLGGDLAAKLGLLAAVTVEGENAEYSIDGGPAQQAASNTISFNGTSITLNALTNGTPAAVTINQDTTSAVNAIKGFVADFNAVLDLIDKVTKADGSATNNTSGPLSGDSSLRQLKSDLRSIITSQALNIGGSLTTLNQIGLSFGAVGSALGSTNTLKFDEAVFKDALSNDAAGVQNLLSALTLSPTLEPAGTGSITGMTGTFAGTQPGKYVISDDGFGNLQAVFSPANGGPSSTTNATVVAGGTNTTLIPGMTLTIGGVLQTGTHTINVAASTQSVLQRLKQFAEIQSGAGGVLQKRQDTYDKVTKDIGDRIVKMEERIDNEMEFLRKKFAAMEQAQAQAQGVLSSLTQMMNQMQANASASRR